MPDVKNKEIIRQIISCYYKVYNTLGYGFLEKVYENAMFIELSKTVCKLQKQSAITVNYQGNNVGNYYADLIVDDSVIIELKAAESIFQDHENQLINYLKATNIEIGLLLNFGKKPEFKRKIFSNFNKSFLKPASSV